MSRRTNSWNAYESGLSGAVGTGDTTFPIDSTLGLVAPGYLVVDPDDPAKREYFRYETVTATNLQNITRGLDGSAAGAVAHESGARVRAVALKQWLDDIFDDIEDLEAWDLAHVTTDPDPHPIYLEVAGDTMAGPLILWADPAVALEAATKQYVDNQAAAVLPSGTRMIFDQDTAPVGWTRDTTTVDDRVIRIVTGARADGGSWTQPDHVHSGIEHTHTGPSHTHSNPTTAGGGSHNHLGALHNHAMAAHTHASGGQTGPASGTSIAVEDAGTTFAYTTGSHTHADPASGGMNGQPFTGNFQGSTDVEAAHTHTQGATGAAGTGATGPVGTDDTDGAATAPSWRPLHRDMIIAVKN